MASLVDSNGLIKEGNLQAFFHGSLKRAAREHQIEAGDATLHYLTHLLTDYAHADRIFDRTQDGIGMRPLAIMYSDAIHAGSVQERRLWLRRLGDVALFIGGLFAGRLSRRLSDIDYCIAMGGNAYDYLHQTADDTARGRALREIYGELANNFGRFVDLLATATCRAVNDEQDLIRLHKNWLAAGSPTTAHRLQARGVEFTTPKKVH